MVKIVIFNMSATAILDFVGFQFCWQNQCCGTSFSVPVSNLVQIGSKMAKLWPFNGFQNGGRRYLGFLTYEF